MTCAGGRPGRLFRGLALLLGWAMAAGPATAVDSAAVSRFLTMSDRFHAQLPGSPVAGLADQQRRTRAVCILTRFEEGFGAQGVPALLSLMDVLSKGAQFDDPTIIEFNERYGADYERIQAECTRQARDS